MIVKQNMHDIILYNHQGVIDVSIVVKIEIIGEDSDVLYSLANGAIIRDDVILEYLGNAKRIQERIYEGNSEDKQ